MRTRLPSLPLPYNTVRALLGDSSHFWGFWFPLQLSDTTTNRLQEGEEKPSELQQKGRLDKSHHITLSAGKRFSLGAHFVLGVASVLQEVPNITQPRFNFLPGIHTAIYQEDVGCSFTSKSFGNVLSN